MPAPYYDNLYSADSDDEPDAFSPTDGYFHASADANPASASPHSPSSSSSPRSNVPHVPNVFVEDPTLPSRESKAREARSESEQHSHLINSGSAWGCDEPASSVGHGVNNDLETGLAGNTSSSSAPSQARGSLSARSPTHHLEAPPAYTPPQPNNYNTFSPPTMGQPDEHRHLLSHEPESMSNSNPATPSPPSRWQRIKSSIAKLNLRNKIKTTLGFLVVFSVVFMVFSSFTLRPSHKVCHLSSCPQAAAPLTFDTSSTPTTLTTFLSRNQTWTTETCNGALTGVVLTVRTASHSSGQRSTCVLCATLVSSRPWTRKTIAGLDGHRTSLVVLFYDPPSAHPPPLSISRLSLMMPALASLLSSTRRHSGIPW